MLYRDIILRCSLFDISLQLYSKVFGKYLDHLAGTISVPPTGPSILKQKTGSMRLARTFFVLRGDQLLQIVFHFFV